MPCKCAALKANGPQVPAHARGALLSVTRRFTVLVLDMNLSCYAWRLCVMAPAWANAFSC